MTDFQERIDLLSDTDLINVIRLKNDYQLEFWNLAVETAIKRGLQSKIDNVIIEIEKEANEKEFESKQKLTNRESLIELYSDRVIILFSVIFTSIAGSILFASNLKRLNRKGGDIVVLFGIIFTLGLLLLGYLLPFRTLNLFVTLLNLLGGFILTIYFGSKYYPENMEYKNRSILKALIVCIMVTMILGVIFIKARKI